MHQGDGIGGSHGTGGVLQSRAMRLSFVATMCVASLHITWGSVSYFVEGDLHPFLLEKLPLPSEALWLGAVQVHVAAAAFALPACLALLSRHVVRSFPRVHRWLGRGTAAVILAGLVPSGTYLAFFATGGAPSTVGFLLSAAIVAFTMVRAIQTARARLLREHRRFIAHVVAQLSVAGTSRALLILFHLTALDDEIAYVLALWVPIVLSLLFVEWARLRAHQRRSSDEARPLRPLVLDALRQPGAG